jgi:hypothetical protein
VGDLKRRLAAIENQHKGPSILDMTLQKSGLSAPEYHAKRAWAMASRAEREERDRLYHELVEIQERGEEMPGETYDAYLELQERVMRREAPTLADDVRVHRDLVHRILEQLVAEWEEQGRRHSTSESDPAFWNVSTAEVNRSHTIHRGAPLILDPEEALEIVAQIVEAKNVQQVFRLVERI